MSVTAFKHDIFLSYAHVDDIPPTGVEDGWVSTLVKNLEIRLGQNFGRLGMCTIWRDHDKLAGNVDVTPEIQQALEESATFLVILSRGYLASEWCDRERSTFLSFLDKRLQKSAPLFVVHRNPIDREEVPSIYRDKLGYKFWFERDNNKFGILGDPVPNPSLDREYYQSVDDLSREILDELKQVVASPGPTGGTVPTRDADTSETTRQQPGTDDTASDVDEETATETPNRKIVFLAEATDDQDAHRDEAIRYLNQYGYSVLPQTWYSRDVEEFRESMKRDLEQSLLFAQLLDDSPGKKLRGSDQSFTQVQYDLAVESGKRIIQWRRRDIDLEEIANADFRRILEASTVRAEDFVKFLGPLKEAADEEFRRLTAPPEPALPVGPQLVFVNSGPEDNEFADVLRSELTDSHGLVSLSPVFDGKPDEIRATRETFYNNCDGMVVVYGKSPASWVQQQLFDLITQLHKRTKPMPPVVVVEAPPDTGPKAAFNVTLPKMQVINCRNGLDSRSLTSFTRQLAE